MCYNGSSPRRCYVRGMLLRVSRNSRENTCTGVSLLLEEGLWRRHFPVRVGFVEFMGLPLFIEHLGATASVTKNTGVTNKQHTITADLVDLTKPMFAFVCITTPTRL